MTKIQAKSAQSPLTSGQVEVGLAYDGNTSPAGIHGLTELFKYANQFAAKRQKSRAASPIRVTHWRADDGDKLRCTYDSCPGSAHALTALIVPGSGQATVEPIKDGAMVGWLLQQHEQGVVIAGVCSGVFILAKTALLSGRQATTHWALSNQFADQFADVLLGSDQMVIDYGDVVTAGGVLAWADLGLRLVERFLGPTIMSDTAHYMLVDPPRARTTLLQRLHTQHETRGRRDIESTTLARNASRTACRCCAPGATIRA